MKITELSRISGINAATIRSYRLKGFLHPVKEKNGYYDYTAEDLVSLAYLRKLRGFSMSLEDIDTLFEASDPGRMLSLLDRESCRIQAKIHELEEQLRFLDFEKQHLTESMQKDGDSVREFQAIDDKLDFYEKDILSENLPPAFYRMATPSLLVAKEVLNKEDSVFEHLFIDLEYILSPNTVLMDGTLKLGERDPSPKNKNSMRNNLGDTGIVSVSKTRRKTG